MYFFESVLDNTYLYGKILIMTTIQSTQTLAIRELGKILLCNWNRYSFFSRMVCESLINSDTLEWERTQLWALTFKLVRKIIGGVDYKVFFS